MELSKIKNIIRLTNPHFFVKNKMFMILCYYDSNTILIDNYIIIDNNSVKSKESPPVEIQPKIGILSTLNEQLYSVFFLIGPKFVFI